MFLRYDSDEDGRLGFWEYSNILLPIENELRESAENRHSTYAMENETRTMILKIIRRCVDNEVQIEMIRQKLQRHLPLPLRNIFMEIDWKNQGFITKQEIRRMIEHNKEYISPITLGNRSHPDSIEMEALIRRFNKDKQNGKISLTEWVEELTPKHEQD